MRKRARILVIPMAFALIATSQLPAHAVVGTLFALAAEYIQSEAKIAFETPGHAEWCAQRHARYVAEWNSYPVANGRRRHCASPFYTPPWMK